MAPREKPRRDILKHAKLSITPMIDVVFLLLIFFMVGMKFRELDRTLEAILPAMGPPPRHPVERPDAEIWILIKNRGAAAHPAPKIVIDQVAMSDWDAVYARLARLAEVGSARTDVIVVAPDDDALHAWVMKVLDYLNQLRFEKISFRK